MGKIKLWYELKRGYCPLFNYLPKVVIIPRKKKYGFTNQV